MGRPPGCWVLRPKGRATWGQAPSAGCEWVSAALPVTYLHMQHTPASCCRLKALGPLSLSHSSTGTRDRSELRAPLGPHTGWPRHLRTEDKWSSLPRGEHTPSRLRQPSNGTRAGPGSADSMALPHRGGPETQRQPWSQSCGAQWRGWAGPTGDKHWPWARRLLAALLQRKQLGQFPAQAQPTGGTETGNVDSALGRFSRLLRHQTGLVGLRPQLPGPAHSSRVPGAPPPHQ